MKRTLPWLLLGFLAIPRPVAADSCAPEETKVFRVETKCTELGIELTDMGDEKSAFACLTDPIFVRTCGPDGRVARLRAFSDWLKKVKDYQQTCEDAGGTFGYVDPAMTEPTTETFCENPRIVTKPGYFEQTMCNAVASCGQGVGVRCSKACSGEAIPADFRVYASPSEENRYTVAPGEPGPSMFRSN